MQVLLGNKKSFTNDICISKIMSKNVQLQVTLTMLLTWTILLDLYPLATKIFASFLPETFLILKY